MDLGGCVAGGCEPKWLLASLANHAGDYADSSRKAAAYPLLGTRQACARPFPLRFATIDQLGAWHQGKVFRGLLRLRRAQGGHR
jgi:hypothetical protein